MPGWYWNEEIETLSSDGIERLESERLQAQMAYLYASSDYFRARFDQAGLKPQTIKNRFDLAAIPFMEKHEIAESQQQGQLLGIVAIPAPWRIPSTRYVFLLHRVMCNNFRPRGDGNYK